MALVVGLADRPTPIPPMGSDFYLDAVLDRLGTVLLDGAGGRERENRSLVFTDPVGEIVARSAGEVKQALEQLDKEVDAGRFVAGYLTYEAGEALVLGGAAGIGRPLVQMWIYDRPPMEPARIQLQGGRSLASPGLDPAMSREDYRKAFARVEHHIREGDVYQVNLTAGHEFDWFGDPVGLYAALRQRQPVAYGAFINAGERYVLSFSPELFFRREGNRIQTRPMKGTAARHHAPDADKAAAESLQRDAKSRAENLMIVDLLRNDLSVVCLPGSVVTDKLFDVEALPTVWQMTSEIGGELRRDATYADIFGALFPCGSITGAPKHRAMQIIRSVESGHRGVYCGAIGYAAPTSSEHARAVFNVAIRTIEIDRERGRLGTGGGIVADSRADDEFDEMMLKTSFFAPAALDANDALIETMKLSAGVIPLIDHHLKRLRRSASYFGIELDEDELRRRIQSLPQQGEWKVRLTLDPGGSPRLETSPYEGRPARPLRLGVFPERVCRGDLWRYHKTTRREIFGRARQWAQSQGLDEALLLNEEGEATEGTITTLVIRRGDVWLTPRLGSGRLPGVALDAFSREHHVEEAALRVDDIRAADEILLMNAVRGPVPAILL